MSLFLIGQQRCRFFLCASNNSEFSGHRNNIEMIVCARQVSGQQGHHVTFAVICCGVRAAKGSEPIFVPTHQRVKEETLPAEGEEHKH